MSLLIPSRCKSSRILAQVAKRGNATEIRTEGTYRGAGHRMFQRRLCGVYLFSLLLLLAGEPTRRSKIPAIGTRDIKSFKSTQIPILIAVVRERLSVTYVAGRIRIIEGFRRRKRGKPLLVSRGKGNPKSAAPFHRCQFRIRDISLGRGQRRGEPSALLACPQTLIIEESRVLSLRGARGAQR